MKKIIILFNAILLGILFVSCKGEQVDYKIIQDAYNSVSDSLPTSTTSNFSLLSDVSSVQFSYASDNAAIVINNQNAVVTRSENDVLVKLTITAVFRETTATYHYNVIVLGLEAVIPTPTEYSVIFHYGSDVKVISVPAGAKVASSDVPTPNLDSYIFVGWFENGIEVIVTDVVINESHIFNAKYSSVSLADNPIAITWSEVIAILYSNVTDGNVVDQNLVLPLKGETYATAKVTWTTTNSSVISLLGILTKPMDADTSVTLSAKLRVPKTLINATADYQETRSFTFVVHKYQIPWDEVTNFTASDVSGVQLLQDKMASLGQVIQAPSYSSEGITSVNAIVVPIDFSNDSFTPEELDKIEKGWFGTSQETGWESLRTFYQKSSYNHVDINGVVTPVVHTNVTVAQFETAGAYGNKNYLDYNALKLALDTIKDSINFAQHDANGDGYIDAIYIVYSAPQQLTGTYPPYWTYHDLYRKSEYTLGDISYEQNSVVYRPYGYVWYSVENLIENVKELDINVNAEIIIHESGRFFGLPYYYEYARGPEVQNGLGYMDMMHSNTGDHGPWSKLVMGWIAPQVVTSSAMIKLSPASTTGQTLLIKPNWNNSYYGDYLLVDYYTPNGMYAIQAQHYTGMPVFTTRGVRIYYVTFNPTTSFNPASNIYTNGKLIQLFAGSGPTITSESPATDAALFNQASTYSWSKFKFADGSRLNIKVLTIDPDDDYAVISITFI
ncbi:MAG: hypothetical protein LBV51_01660 [Acholeplasmatales bacterium]|jgi:M6 family metalloprotease-like protein|nr:hypothetical protein [Acholeplasmatales bacterium]